VAVSVVRCARRPTLRDPIAIIAFGGWGDAAEASTTAVATLASIWNAQIFATIDPDEFYDFTEVRPRVFLTDSMTRDVEWPVGMFSFRRRPRSPNDVIMFQALEPQLRWRLYTKAFIDFLRSMNVSLMMSMGSLLADVPHTKPVRISGFATTSDLQSRLRAARVATTSYEGPTGILGVLHREAVNQSLPSLSLWAAAPHYIAASTNPAVALGLLRTLADLTGWSLDLGHFRQEVKTFQAEVDAVIQSNPEALAYIRQLEDQIEETAEHDQSLPSHETLLKDLEEFLRRDRSNDDPRG
jgi:predicted ATP-grasp superfamily ATP-dependent carboligase